MKFSDGYWLTRPDMTVLSAAHVYDVRRDETSVTVYAPCKPILRRENTVDNPMLTVRFSSPQPDVIAVQVWHFMGADQKGPAFPIRQQENLAVEITENDQMVSLTSGKTRVCIAKGNAWSVTYEYDGHYLTGSNFRHLSHVQAQDGRRFMKEQLDLSVGECVYGLGERFTPFVKNGQVVDCWNEDGGTCSEQAYKNIPFYLTNRNYGVLVAHPELVSFEVASEVVTRTQFSVPGEYLSYYVIGAASPKDVLRRYTDLTGKPALPPAWSFGLWLTTSFTTSYDETTVNSFVDGMKQRNIPLHVFHFDCFWMKEFQLCDFEWDTDLFPDPAAMLSRLKAKGLRICVWINPYIAQKSGMFAEGKAQGYLVKKPDGSVWQWNRWQSGQALVDFTNPAAVVWFQEKLRKLLKIGVDCFKTDFGERIPTDVAYYDGSDPYKMHNYYTYLYNQAVFTLLVDEYGKNRSLVFARSATVGSQEFPVHWGGDSTANYGSMAESLRGGLSLGLSGFGFWSHDISGFEKTATPDLYKRWVAFGLLSTHSRLHGNESYRVPWLFDDEAVEVLRHFVNLKCRLMPYLFAASCQAASEGIAVMRAMMLEFPNDPTCDYLDRQYMLGDSLLIAPIFSPDGLVSYYLPQGEWTHFLTGEKVNGGSWRQDQYDYFSLPIMARANALIAVGPNTENPDYDFADQVVFHSFQLQEGKNASAVICNQDAAVEMALTLQRQDNQIIATWQDTGKPWSLLLRGQSTVQGVSGGTASADAQGVMIRANAGESKMIVQL